MIRKWLEAGVIEDGRRVRAVKGTPQGAMISPLMAAATGAGPLQEDGPMATEFFLADEGFL